MEALNWGQVVETDRGGYQTSPQGPNHGVIDGTVRYLVALSKIAARSGHARPGFAVVASEVRSLAGRSAEAAGNQGSISASVQVEQGSALVDQAGATMSEVVNSIQQVADIMGKISAASGASSKSTVHHMARSRSKMRRWWSRWNGRRPGACPRGALPTLPSSLPLSII